MRKIVWNIYRIESFDLKIHDTVQLMRNDDVGLTYVIA